MMFHTMEEARSIVKRCQSGKFLTATMDSNDGNGTGRLVLDCSHHLKPRNTRNGGNFEEGSKGSIDEEEEKKRNWDTLRGRTYQVRFIAESTQTYGYLQPFKMNITTRILPPDLKFTPVIEKQQLNSTPCLCNYSKLTAPISIYWTLLTDRTITALPTVKYTVCLYGKTLTIIRRSIAGVCSNAENALNSSSTTWSPMATPLDIEQKDKRAKQKGRDILHP